MTVAFSGMWYRDGIACIAGVYACIAVPICILCVCAHWLYSCCVCTCPSPGWPRQCSQVVPCQATRGHRWRRSEVLWALSRAQHGVAIGWLNAVATAHTHTCSHTGRVYLTHNTMLYWMLPVCAVYTVSTLYTNSTCCVPYMLLYTVCA